MTKEDIIRLISLGETTEVQFKERILDACKAAIEMFPFYNSMNCMMLKDLDSKTGVVNLLLYERDNLVNNVVPGMILKILMQRSNSRTAPVRPYISNDRLQRYKVLFVNGVYLIYHTGAESDIIKATCFDHNLMIVNDKN